MWFPLMVCMFLGTGMVTSLDNGLGLTPPMGWLAWQRFRCNIDCDEDPDDCISERLFRQMADHLVADGYKDAGYEYLSLDDCWMEMQRGSDFKLKPDAKRFPSGIKALSDYVHSKGLKFGIYADFGTKTCEGYPGSQYYLQMDADTFAEWEVDFVKVDGCYADPKQFEDAYPTLGKWLNRTGRPMLYSCSWPTYWNYRNWTVNYTLVAEHCNIWRNWWDIDDSWESLRFILDFYGGDRDNFSKIAGPGNFNDPDMIIIGNFGLSYSQERVQMGMWAMMASPLLMSNDLRKIRPESKALLLNKNLIGINQDPLGIQGRRVIKTRRTQIWTRMISGGRYAFAYLNVGVDGMRKKISVKLSSMGLIYPHGYRISEAFENKYIGIFPPHANFTVRVEPSGIFMGIATPFK